MNIAQVICIFPPKFGGMGNSVLNFSQALVELGHEVTVFTPSYGEEGEVADLEDKAKKFKVVKLRPLLRLGNAAVLPQLLWRLQGFDIVHLHYPFYGSAEIVWLKRLFCHGQK